MNEVLSTSINEILQRVLTGVDSTVAFLSEEIPDIVMQLLYWNAAKGTVLSLFGFLLFILAYQIIKPSKWVAGNLLEDYGELSTKGTVSVCSSLSTSIAGIAFFCENVMTPLQIWIAPKVWLLEYASTLTK